VGTANNRVDLLPSASPRAFYQWATNPIRYAINVSAVIRTGGNSDPDKDKGRYRLFFETPLASAQYVVQLTGSLYTGQHDRQAALVGVNVADTPGPPAPDAPPQQKQNPSINSFDVICGISNIETANPDYLFATVFL
jgi:hypothetical protein